MAGSGLSLQLTAHLDHMVHLFKMSSLSVMANGQMGLSAVVTGKTQSSAGTGERVLRQGMRGCKSHRLQLWKISHELRKLYLSNGAAGDKVYINRTSELVHGQLLIIPYKYSIASIKPD